MKYRVLISIPSRVFDRDEIKMLDIDCTGADFDEHGNLLFYDLSLVKVAVSPYHYIYHHVIEEKKDDTK